ncbi:MAG: hypothetical protein LBJ17_04555 [Dysgonamonadaceae bacterium]|jgi:hypothetical protein|nr:hypothetical protein [Dysgonamonadaceae bacterium]
MKKTLFMLMFAAIVAGNINAQNNKEPKREVLFTLAANEEIESGEYFVLQQVKGNHFACIIYDTLGKNYTFVFNGKRMDVGNYYYYPDFYHLNVHEENGYVFGYSLQDGYYVNIKGKVYGPFDGGSLTFASDSKGNTDFNKFHYAQTEGERTTYYIHRDGTKDGPFDRVHFPGKHDALPDREFLYMLDDRWYARYSDGSSKKVQEAPAFAYVHEKGGKYYVNINGRDSKGYDGVWDLQSTESGKYAYRYKENGKWHAITNIDGTEKSSRGYDYCSEDIHLTESGKYAYLYKENGKWHANANGKEIEEHDYLTGLEMDDKGNYSFYDNHDDGRIYNNNNGKETKTEYLTGMEWRLSCAPDLFASNNRYKSRQLEIYSPDKEHSFDSSYEHAHVVIDGVTHGHAPALYAWYDAEKNAFIWNAIEGKELVIYEYKL